MAGIRFFAPYGWPAPPAGWLPPGNWRPAPEWPAAPAGWAFYRGEHGEPVPTPAGCWVPPAAAVPTAPVWTPPAASAVSAASGPIPYLAAPAASAPVGAAPSRPGRPPVWVWLAAGGGLLALVLAAVFVLPRFNRGPELTSSQFNRLTINSSQFLGGAGLADQVSYDEWEEADSDYESCERLYDLHGDHYRTGAASEGEPYVWASLYDDVDAAAQYLDLDVECTTARFEDQSETWEVGTRGSTDGANWVEYEADWGDRVFVQYGNVIASADLDSVDRDRFVRRLVEQINAVAR
jgi:hypothetical protein